MNPLAAARAYGAALNQINGGADKASAAPSAGNDFSSIMKNALQETYKSTQNAETQMSLNAQGKTELIDAVTAVSSAQQNLETVIAIRDQVISAYQEIMRMPI
jgi:flagellar hook-basal body complex protein FliE